MRTYRMPVTTLMIGLLSFLATTKATAQASEELKTLKLGDVAKDVEFQPLEGDQVKLSTLTREGPVVLVVLRGFPGYQ